MPAAYSLDLREKVIAIHKQEKISHAKLAKRFNISVRSVNQYSI
jgi:transposase